MFTTENGAASLVLQEIPTQGCAYVTLQASQDPEALLADCIAVCRMAGAELVYATGHPMLTKFPEHTAVWKMTCAAASLEETDAALWPVQEDTALEFQRIYNEKVRRIPNGAWMHQARREEMCRKGTGYFIHRQETLLGIGMVEGSKILFVASIVPGAGEAVVKALARCVTEETITLEVASANRKALGLYERLGFVKTGVLSQWYRVV